MAIDIVADILKREKGYVNNPADRGGATNFGITTHTYRWWTKNPNADVRNLTEAVAREILTDIYLVKPRIVELPEPVKSFMADWAVHSGPYMPIMAMQDILNVTVDGVIGAETLKAVHEADLSLLLRFLVRKRMLMIARIVQKSPIQAQFLVGWTERVLSFLS